MFKHTLDSILKIFFKSILILNIKLYHHHTFQFVRVKSQNFGLKIKCLLVIANMGPFKCPEKVSHANALKNFTQLLVKEYLWNFNLLFYSIAFERIFPTCPYLPWKIHCGCKRFKGEILFPYCLSDCCLGR